MNNFTIKQIVIALSLIFVSAISFANSSDDRKNHHSDNAQHGNRYGNHHGYRHHGHGHRRYYSHYNAYYYNYTPRAWPPQPIPLPHFYFNIHH